MDNEQLGLPQAPAAPIPEPIEPPEPRPLPQPEPAARAPKKIRRVGTFTMGLCLVIAGLALTVGLFRPATDFTLLFKLAPLVLVALGVEVLIASATAREQKLKYDFLSMFVCFLLIVCVAAAAVCAPWMEYFGPQRQPKVNQLRTQWNQALYEKLEGAEEVYNLQSNLWIDAPVRPAQLTLAQVEQDGSAWVKVTLEGDYADKTAFAAACQKLIPALTGAGVADPQMEFQTLEGKEHPTQYRLEVNGLWMRQKDAAGLAKAVETLRWSEEHGYYMDDEEWADWQREQWEDAA